jgi:AcrR family transcriptional regulator
LAPGSQRMKAEARKRQIVEVTLGLIAEYGLRGATMARIAAGAGIRQASLYTHFASRRAILLAALDVVYEKIYASRETRTNENSLDRLRQMCDHHLELWAAQGERHHAHLLLEFIAGARSEGLREVLAQKHLESLRQFVSVVEEGQKEGKIPAYVDPEQVAWLITGWAFAGDVEHLMGFKQFLEPNIGVHWLDVIFASFVAGPAGLAKGDAGKS